MPTLRSFHLDTSLGPIEISEIRSALGPTWMKSEDLPFFSDAEKVTIKDYEPIKLADAVRTRMDIWDEVTDPGLCRGPSLEKIEWYIANVLGSIAVPKA